MKKVFACLLAVAMLLSLVACAKDGKSDDKSSSGFDNIFDSGESTELTEKTEDTTEPTETEPSNLTPTGPEETYPDQLAVIVANRAVWMNNDELFAPQCLYTAADLDHNGLLEIWFGACMGTGIYTYMYAWEVSEDMTELIALERDYDEYYSQADMMCAEADVYYDSDSRSFYYIFTDDARNGWAWNGTDVRALLVKDGKLSEQTIASRSCETDNDYVSTTTYYDASGKEISEAEFEAAAESYFAGLQAMQASFLWQTIDDGEFDALSDEALLETLQEALEGFTVS